MKRLANGTFCVLPFIESFQDISGRHKLCCHSDVEIDHVESDSTTQLREKILAGEKIPHCTKCYQLEENRSISPRLKESVQWLKDSEVKNYIDLWDKNTPTRIFFYDLRYDSKCNLACVSCDAKSSSLWAKELGLPKNTTKINVNADYTSAKKIYLAGGEPLIISKFIDLIEKIANSDHQPELVINTNLTRINNSLQILLKQIKNLTLTVSVDAFESINEYHRWPLRWSKFLENLKWARSINCTIQFNSVVDAVTILNIDKLCSIEHMADQWNLSVLTYPSALKLQNLPEHLKTQAYENFSKIKLSKFYKTDPVFKSRVEYILDLINQPGNPDLLSLYIDQIDKRRSINHTTFLGVSLT